MMDNLCINDPCGVGATCQMLPPGTVNEYGLSYNCTKCASGQELVSGKCVDTGIMSYVLLKRRKTIICTFLFNIV